MIQTRGMKAKAKIADKNDAKLIVSLQMSFWLVKMKFRMMVLNCPSMDLALKIP